MARRRAPTPVPADPLLDEVRGLRAALSARFDDDLHELCGHLRKGEGQYAAQLVQRRPDGSLAWPSAGFTPKPVKLPEPSADPLIDEVRGLRAALWEQVGGTMEGLIAHLREVEARHRDRLAPPKQRRRKTG